GTLVLLVLGDLIGRIQQKGAGRGARRGVRAPVLHRHARGGGTTCHAARCTGGHAGAESGQRLGGCVDSAEHGRGLGILVEGCGTLDEGGGAARDRGGDVAGERDGARVAVLAVLRQAREDHAVQRRRDRRVVRRGRQRLLAHVLVGDGDRGIAGERRTPGEHL